jgi:protein-S-isoprenylcysteine O-methyltransferase Ste14
MFWRLLQPLLILPGTVLVFVPAVTLYACRNTHFSHKVAAPGHPLFWLALPAACLGLSLAAWTVGLFTKYGRGTPAPWDPPQKLVVRGPYRYTRNPMITAVLSMLAAEAMFFQSWPLFLWLVFFFLLNNIYFPLFEERSLEKRFGEKYLDYKKNVPRWIPRMRPWTPSN